MKRPRPPQIDKHEYRLVGGPLDGQLVRVPKHDPRYDHPDRELGYACYEPAMSTLADGSQRKVLKFMGYRL